jgi:hemolysin III
MFEVGLREPWSAATHGLGAVLVLPGIWFLLRRGTGDRSRQFTLLVYGLALLACYSASMSFHAALGPPEHILRLAVADRVGIYLLIAGTYTPIAWNLLSGVWRSTTLTLVWLAATAGCGLHCSIGLVPPWVSTVLYLLMGWGAVVCLGELARNVPRREVRRIVAGGLLYSVGAIINLSGWPNPVPDVFGFHEIFHLFVLAGSLMHFSFVLNTVAVATAPRPPKTSAPGAVPRPKFLTPPYRRSRVS